MDGDGVTVGIVDGDGVTVGVVANGVEEGVADCAGTLVGRAAVGAREFSGEPVESGAPLVSETSSGTILKSDKGIATIPAPPFNEGDGPAVALATGEGCAITEDA